MGTNYYSIPKTKELEDYWDNNNWLKGILENNLESLEYLRELLCNKGIKQFKMFLRKLVEVKWL
tara:strand:+ start:69 stop:260 length:192 start_codon:yes stop_codon:yes gene_type:complete